MICDVRLLQNYIKSRREKKEKEVLGFFSLQRKKMLSKVFAYVWAGPESL